MAELKLVPKEKFAMPTGIPSYDNAGVDVDVEHASTRNKSRNVGKELNIMYAFICDSEKPIHVLIYIYALYHGRMTFC